MHRYRQQVGRGSVGRDTGRPGSRRDFCLIDRREFALLNVNSNGNDV